MNTIYIVRMMDECVRTFNSETSKRVCDLVPSKTLILFLSTAATRQLTLGPRDAGFAQPGTEAAHLLQARSPLQPCSATSWRTPRS